MLIAFYGKMIKKFVKPPCCLGSLNPLWHGLISYFKARGMLLSPAERNIAITETNNTLYENPNTK